MTSKAEKSPNAFRTISEVSTSMGVPQHVLRFWEGKFSQIAPMKRGGGRRYYRPEDVEIIEVIRKLLHEDGYTIKGAQKYLKENGVKNVLQAFSEVAENENASDSTRSQNEYETQILNMTKKSAQNISTKNIQAPFEDTETVAALKAIKIRLENIRQHLKMAKN